MVVEVDDPDAHGGGAGQRRLTAVHRDHREARLRRPLEVDSPAVCHHACEGARENGAQGPS